MDEGSIAKAYINSRMANKLELQENEVVTLKSKNGQIRVQIVMYYFIIFTNVSL